MSGKVKVRKSKCQEKLKSEKLKSGKVKVMKSWAIARGQRWSVRRERRDQ